MNIPPTTPQSMQVKPLQEKEPRVALIFDEGACGVPAMLQIEQVFGWGFPVYCYPFSDDMSEYLVSDMPLTKEQLADPLGMLVLR